ncbi:MAG: SAM-dependent methyltransferase, partial [Acidimicrobiia bacterium]
ARQQACFDAVASRLTPGGRFVVEAFVPDDPPRDGDAVDVRTLDADRVVLSISRHDAATQRADGQFVELSEAGGVRLRPWSIRYARPDELDDMAGRAGLAIEHRWEAFGRVPLRASSARHVTVYRRT